MDTPIFHEIAPSFVQAYDFPNLIKRYKALLIDFILLFSCLITIMILFQNSEYHTQIMLASSGILFLSYEPLLTTYSQTLGQRIMRIRVRKNNNPTQKIRLTDAYLRWFLKIMLGWVSFITIHANPEHRAIHDILSSSVVINNN